MSYEDLATYTEVDPHSHISKTATRVTLSVLTADEDAYVYKDFGVGYFDAIDIDFTIEVSNSSQDDGYLCVGVANNVDDGGNWASYIKVRAACGAADYDLQLLTSTDNDSLAALSFDAPYYCTLRRAAGNDSVTLYVYSDSGRTVLVGSKSIAGASTTKWRYFYPAASNDRSKPDKFDGYVEYFDLNPVSSNAAPIMW